MSPLGEGRYGHTAVSSSDDRLYVIGGAAKASPAALPTVRDTIFWTPLLFFTKQASTDELVWAGQEISYEIKVVSNNVRDLHDLVLTDNLPDNFQVYDAPDFSQDGQILTWSIPELLIGHHVVKVIYGLVGSPETPTTPQAARDAVPISTEIVLTPTSEQEARPTAVLSRPTVDPKICEIPDIYPQSGTPRPKPTCTPTPPITVPVTITDTAVPPQGDTTTPTRVTVLLIN